MTLKQNIIHVLKTTNCTGSYDRNGSHDSDEYVEFLEYPLELANNGFEALADAIISILKENKQC